jgi:capsular polysaccharide transport system permease protein
MTTKPTARRFRIRRAATPADARPDEAAAPAGAAPAPPPPPAAAAGAPAPAGAARTGDLTPAAEVGIEAEIDAIRREGLTGRQLRLARRVAQKHAIPATSDFDAVRQLRQAGIDPFERASVLELVTEQADGGGGGGPPGSRALTTVPRGDPNLPQTVRPAPPPGNPADRAEASHAADILRIQRDIARRRRRKSLLLVTRLLFFVGLPTLLAGIYYSRIATPLYASKSEFVIQQAESQAGGGLGGLFSGTQFATSQDSIAVQGYLKSRDAMQRLDSDVGFRVHFTGEGVDPIQRIADDASTEAAYKVYQRNVKIGYDPTEGIVKMEVSAPDPALAQEWSRALISYAEEKVDHLTQRLREDQMTGARASYEEAEARMLEAQRRVVDLQERYQVLSSEVEVGLITTQIGNLETQLTQDRLSLIQMQSNENPNQARMEPIQRRIEVLEREIAALRARLTADTDSGRSLAQVQGELLVAQADVETRQLLLAQALQQMETARVEVNRQVRYLSVSVNPVAPDEPSYPRAFENTAVAFLIFAGIYLMISMTASILREQVSA